VAVQIALAQGARALGVASPANHEYLRGLGASDVFDYHAAVASRHTRGEIVLQISTRV
jgi:NADPH:quinone reductase